MRYDAIIIGGGLGGLLSSVLLAQRGKRVLLLEQHRIPGGCCTSYPRRGFTFNVPSIMGDLGSGDLRRVLAELGFYDEIRWSTFDNFARFIYPDFEIALPANNLPACQEQFTRAFPADARAIHTFFADIQKAQRGMALMQQTGRSLLQTCSLLCAVPGLLRLARTSFHDYMRRLTSNTKLITVLSSMWGYSGLPARQVPAIFILGLSGDCYGKPISFPEDGFQAVPDFFARKLEQLGGEIRYQTGVAKILLDGKTATGVETTAGEVLHADAVISNADTRRTFLDLVGRTNLSRRFAASVDAHTPSVSGVSLHIGTDLDLSRLDLGYAGVFVQESWEDSDTLYDRAVANRVCFQGDSIGFGLQAPSLQAPGLAPAGKHILHLLVAPVAAQYKNGFNRNQGRRGKEYRKTKQELTRLLISKAERLVPGLSSAVEVSEMATPFTFERYTGATGGAWYDGVCPAGAGFKRPQAKTPINRLYLTGTKAFAGGGMPPALVGGMMTARIILAGG